MQHVQGLACASIKFQISDIKLVVVSSRIKLGMIVLEHNVVICWYSPYIGQGHGQVCRICYMALGVKLMDTAACKWSAGHW